MSDTKMISLEINEGMVRPILEKQVQAAVLANIGNPEELIAKCVSIALKQKVNRDGKIASSSYHNEYDFLETITGNAIREAAQKALRGWLEENVQLVKEMVVREMNKPERQKSMVKAFADAAEQSLQCAWGFNCDITFTSEDKQYVRKRG